MPTPELIPFTHSSSFWENVSFVAAFLVFIGVLMESVADFHTLARWTKLDRNEKTREHVAKIGLIILLVALALEVPIGMEIHRINEQTISSLSAKLSLTLQHEAELTKLTEALELSNGTIEAKIKSLKAKNEQLLTVINAEQHRQARMREVITPRNLSKKQVADLVSRCRSFAGTPFDLMVSNDPDSQKLVELIGNGLTQAGWLWKSTPEIGMLSIGLDNKHEISVITLDGISIEIAESAKSALGEASKTLQVALSRNGIHSTLRVQPDAHIDKAFSRRVIHISVGSKD